MRSSGVLFVLCLALTSAGQISGPVNGATWGKRLDGTPVRTLASTDTRVLVLFFVATDCPVSNRTFPEMKRLREEFAGEKAQFWFIYPNEGEQVSAVREHQRAYDIGGEALLDPAGTLVQLGRARVTPEIVVLVPDRKMGWKPVYAGRIDDRYVRLGLERPAATQHFAEEAIRAALEGRPPRPALGNPVGCAIMNRSAR